MAIDTQQTVERQNASTRVDRSETKAYLVGGGIASLAAAAFLIRDGHVAGHNITIFEELDRLGGSLDGAGSPEQGYVVRGGRMLEGQYRCTYELFELDPDARQEADGYPGDRAVEQGHQDGIESPSRA